MCMCGQVERAPWRFWRGARAFGLDPQDTQGREVNSLRWPSPSGAPKVQPGCESAVTTLRTGDRQAQEGQGDNKNEARRQRGLTHQVAVTVRVAGAGLRHMMISYASRLSSLLAASALCRCHRVACGNAAGDAELGVHDDDTHRHQGDEHQALCGGQAPTHRLHHVSAGAGHGGGAA